MKILIVEDDALIRLYLKKLFSKYGDVLDVPSGEDALDIFTHSLEDRFYFDLVCMDIVLPHMRGDEAIRKMREAEEKRGIKQINTARILVITALNIQDIHLPLNDHKLSFLTKPVYKSDILREMLKFGFAVENVS